MFCFWTSGFSLFSFGSVSGFLFFKNLQLHGSSIDSDFVGLVELELIRRKIQRMVKWKSSVATKAEVLVLSKLTHSVNQLNFGECSAANHVISKASDLMAIFNATDHKRFESSKLKTRCPACDSVVTWRKSFPKGQLSDILRRQRKATQSSD